MARGLNKVMVIGNVGRDPEMRYMPSGRAVTSFSVATTRSWTNSEGERREETEWFNVVAWGNLAEICRQHLRKGRQVYIEGTVNGMGTDGVLNPRTWTGNDGVVRASFEVTARTIKFLGGRGGGGETEFGGPEEPPPDFVEENDIPF